MERMDQNIENLFEAMERIDEIKTHQKTYKAEGIGFREMDKSIKADRPKEFKD